MKRLKNKHHETAVKHLIEGKTKQQAYSLAYPNSNDLSTKANSYVMFNRADVQARVNEILDSKEASKLPNILAKVTSGLESEKTIVFNSKGQKTTVPDRALQQECAKTLLKLHNAMPDNKAMHVEDNRTQLISLNTNDIQQLGELVSKLEALDKDSDTRHLQSGEVIDVEPISK